MGIIVPNLQGISDGIVAIIVVSAFIKYHKTVAILLKQSKKKTLIGIFLVALGFLFLIFASVAYKSINTGIPSNSYFSYFWSTMGMQFLYDAIGIALIILGGFLINPEATKKIICRLAENILNK